MPISTGMPCIRASLIAVSVIFISNVMERNSSIVKFVNLFPEMGDIC